MLSPAHEGGAGEPASSLIASARKAAFCLAKRHKYGHGCYDVDDLVQDGCVAMLQGRAAWYGCIDGLRRWLNRNRWWKDVPINEALDRSYDPDPLRQIIIDEEYERLMLHMDRWWRPVERTAWMLRHEEDKTEAQIGAVLGFSESRVSQWLREERNLGR